MSSSTRRRPGARNSIAVTGREYCTPDMTIAERVEHIGVTKTPSGCWEWNGARSDTGYGTLKVARRTVAVHRWSLEQKLGRPLDEGEVARHRCDNRSCINPDHLEPGTARDNTLDAVDRGRHRHGDGQPGVPKPHRRLSDAQVAEILALNATGTRPKDIAAAFGVTVSTIYNLRNGWAQRARPQR